MAPSLPISWETVLYDSDLHWAWQLNTRMQQDIADANSNEIVLHCREFLANYMYRSFVGD